MKSPIIFLILLCLFTGCASEDALRPNGTARKGLAKEVLTDTTNTPEAMALAISVIADDNLPPSFWATLANNAEYPKAVRSAFVSHLFRRYVHPGMTLNELATVVGPAKWVKAEGITEIMNFSGAYPVHTSSGDKGYAIPVFADNRPSDIVIFMTFRNKVERGDLLKALAGVISETGGSIVIKDIGVSRVSE